MESKKDKFIERLKHENVALVYSEDWRKKSTAHLRIDASNPNLIRQCSLTEKSEVVQLDSGVLKTEVGPELLSILNGKIPVQAIAKMGRMIQGQQEGTIKPIAFDMTHCRVRKTEATLYKIYELELGKMLVPGELMVNFFPKECNGEYTDQTIEIFCDEFGYFFPQYVSFGARSKKTIVKQFSVDNTAVSGDIIGSTFSQAHQQQNIDNSEVCEGFHSSNVQDFMLNFEPDHIILLQAKNFTPVIELLPFDQKIKLKQLEFYKKRLREPSIMTVNRSAFHKNIGFTGPVGDSAGKEVVAYQEGYFLSSITGFWDGWDSTLEMMAHPVNLIGYVIRERRIPPRKFWQRLLRILVVLQNDKGQKIEKIIGKEGSSRPAGSITIDIRKDVVEELQIGLDYHNGGVGYIAVKTQGKDVLQMVGREDLVNPSTLKKFRIGGKLLGLRGMSNDLIQQLEAVYEVNSNEADVEITRFMMH